MEDQLVNEPCCQRRRHVDLRCAPCGEPMHARGVDVLAGPGSGV